MSMHAHCIHPCTKYTNLIFNIRTKLIPPSSPSLLHHSSLMFVSGGTNAITLLPFLLYDLLLFSTATAVQGQMPCIPFQANPFFSLLSSQKIIIIVITLMTASLKKKSKKTNEMSNHISLYFSYHDATHRIKHNRYHHSSNPSIFLFGRSPIS